MIDLLTGISVYVYYRGDISACDFADFSVFSFFFFSSWLELTNKDRKGSKIHKMRNEEGKMH